MRLWLSQTSVKDPIIRSYRRPKGLAGLACFMLAFVSWQASAQIAVRVSPQRFEPVRLDSAPGGQAGGEDKDMHPVSLIRVACERRAAAENFVIGMRRDDEVEAVAVEVTNKHELSQGRKPVSVEKDNCGWDITSLKDGQVVRYIEVKGRATDGDVCLTANEWIKAQRFGKDYWLYIVTHCKSEPKLHMIQDPASKLCPKEEVKIVRYMVGGKDWKRAAATADTE